MNIRKIRENLTVSQAQFSEILGITQYRLSALELEKYAPSKEEIAKITLTADKIKRGEIILRKKKRIFKETFNTSIVASNPRRSYTRTKRNGEYISLLNALAYEFNKNDGTGPKAISFFSGCGGLCYGITAAGFNIVASNELVDSYRNIIN